MHRILQGLRRYEHTTKPAHAHQFAELAAGQSPLALFITCADSRIVPNLLVSARPGELFVLRNVANLVPPDADEADSSAVSALWYAVEVLGVDDVVVCGHSSCGGMKALLAHEPPPSKHLQRWLKNGHSAREAWRAGQVLDPSLPDVDQLSQTSALKQLDHLRTYPWIESRIASDQLRLHAWWFEIATGRVLAYADELGKYVPALDRLERSAGNGAYALAASVA